MAPPQDKKKPDVRKAVAYIRVATADHHLGPEAQRAAIDLLYAANG